MTDWNWELLPGIFEERTGMNIKTLKNYDVMHPFIGSSFDYSLRHKHFDTPNGAILGCARILLSELRAANKETTTTPIVF